MAYCYQKSVLTGLRVYASGFAVPAFQRPEIFHGRGFWVSNFPAGSEGLSLELKVCLGLGLGFRL